MPAGPGQALRNLEVLGINNAEHGEIKLNTLYKLRAGVRNVEKG